jgi:archaellum component FlaC
MEEIEKAQTLMQNAIQNIGRSLEKIDEELEELKPRLLRLHKKRDKCRDKLLTVAPKQLQVTHAQLDRLVQGVSLAVCN